MPYRFRTDLWDCLLLPVPANISPPLFTSKNKPLYGVHLIFGIQIYKPALKYGLTVAMISALTGITLYLIAGDLVTYGNYNNRLGGVIVSQFIVIALTACVLAGYGAVSSAFRDDKSARRSALSGAMAALIASLVPALIYTPFAAIFDSIFFRMMFYTQLLIVPLPAVIIGTIAGYYTWKGDDNSNCPDIKKFTHLLLLILAIELFVPLAIIFAAVHMGLVPYDPGRVILP